MYRLKRLGKKTLTTRLPLSLGHIVIKRVLRFGFVGALCLLIQIIILTSLERFMPPVIANAIGFVTSAQLNFLLSYRFTWADSARKSGFLLFKTWLKFNTVVLSSACINAAAFYCIIHFSFIDMTAIAAVAATAISTAFTFLVNHFVVLKPERIDHGHTARNSNVPARLK